VSTGRSPETRRFPRRLNAPTPNVGGPSREATPATNGVVLSCTVTQARRGVNADGSSSTSFEFRPATARLRLGAEVESAPLMGRRKGSSGWPKHRVT